MTKLYLRLAIVANPFRLTSFQWDKALDGYKWTKTRPLDGGKEDLFLTTGHPVDLGYGYMRERYEPLKEYTGLFMQFSTQSHKERGCYHLPPNMDS